MKHLRTDEVQNSNDIYSYSSPHAEKKAKSKMQHSESHLLIEDEPPRSKLAVIVPIIAVAVVLIAVLGVIVYNIFSSQKSIAAVENTKISGITADSVTLSWDKVDGANGYHIFQSDNGGDKFVQIGGVSDKLTYTVSDLSQASKYSFCVKAYDDNGDSADYTPLNNVWTLPKKVDVTKLVSERRGEVYLEWTENERCDGYLIEFRTEGKEYREENRVIVDQSYIQSHRITELIPDYSIAVRVTPYLDNGAKTFGEPSEEKTVLVTSLEKKNTTDKPMIALTFDDGPISGAAGGKILDILEQNGAKATFFMLGANCSDNSENLLRKANLGMELGNHGWDGTSSAEELTPYEIMSTTSTIYGITGQYPTAMRSPGGTMTDLIMYECLNESIPSYRWSIDSKDQDAKSADEIYHSVVDNVKDGDIILLHETGAYTAEALERIVSELIAQGYELVTCHDLVVAKTGEEPVAGKEYSNLS